MRKAYDTIDWRFLKKMLEELGFTEKFIGYIMTSIITAKFSLMLNGVMHGYFPCYRGIRQRDPLSPLLFVVCMEYLSRILKRICEQAEFKFHPNCTSRQLTHPCFADDILLCCKGDFNSIHLILIGYGSSCSLRPQGCNLMCTSQKCIVVA